MDRIDFDFLSNSISVIKKCIAINLFVVSPQLELQNFPYILTSGSDEIRGSKKAEGSLHFTTWNDLETAWECSRTIKCNFPNISICLYHWRRRRAKFIKTYCGSAALCKINGFSYQNQINLYSSWIASSFNTFKIRALILFHIVIFFLRKTKCTYTWNIASFLGDFTYYSHSLR